MTKPLKDLRSLSGLTQQALATASGIHVSQVKKLESGEISPENLTLKTALALSDALGIHPADLIERKEVSKLTHTEIYSKVDRILSDLAVTDDRATYEADKSGELYLVADLADVRQALYRDVEAGIDLGDDFFAFAERHGIEILA